MTKPATGPCVFCHREVELIRFAARYKDTVRYAKRKGVGVYLCPRGCAPKTRRMDLDRTPVTR